MKLEGASESQQRAFDSAMQGESIFITGEAGTGKSWLLNRIIEEKEARGEYVLIEAPTGIASLELNGGATIHRTHRVPLDIVDILTKEPSIPDEVKIADVIIIDEVSMVRRDIFDYVMKSLEDLDVQIILVGDFCQLPPVVMREDKEIYEMVTGLTLGKGYCFESEYWHKRGFKVHNLTEPQRQADKQFLNALNQARYGDAYCIGYFNKRAGVKPDKDRDYIYLYGSNRKAEEKNREELSKLDSDLVVYETMITGEVKKSDMKIPDRIEIKEGAQVMALVNDSSGMYSNGTIGTVKRIREYSDEIEIEFPYGEVIMGMYTWDITKYAVENDKLVKKTIGTYTNFPIKLAWAITIHKSQGQTFESVVLDPTCWEEGQLYVALSRVKTIDGLILLRRISPNALKTNGDVVRFYKKSVCSKAGSESDDGYSINIDQNRQVIVMQAKGQKMECRYEGVLDITLLPSKEDKLTTKLLVNELRKHRLITPNEFSKIVHEQIERAKILAKIRVQYNNE